jgi:dTDP-4-amino-4,6-dideoxygalactose transaminase
VTIPLVDLKAQHAAVADEVAEGWARVLDTTAFVLGDDVAAFEDEFAAFSRVAHCRGVANGTDALELALRALDIGPGDEVVVPANTFIASVLAVARTGATPILVDVDPVYHLVDVAHVADAITPRTRAVMPVHLYGQVAQMELLSEAVSGTEIALVEDAAQAQGASRFGTVAGGFGAVAGTSFYPGKNLGAYGDAGAVLTNDDAIAARVTNLRNYGSDVKYHHPEVGFNSRLDTLQAVVLRAKLRRLAGWNEARGEAASRYDELLAGLDAVVRPAVLEGNTHIWHLYVVRVPRRDEVLARLHDAGIGAGIHYPVPVHLQGAFAGLGRGPGSYPVTELAAQEILSLPLFAEITHSQQERVVDELRAALA